MKKIALFMALVMLMSLLAAPAYAAEGPSPSRDEQESSQPVESEDLGEEIEDPDTPQGNLPDEPGEDIGDPDTPQGNLPDEPGEDIGDPDIPQGNLPDEPGEDISDPDTPTGEEPVKSPQTSESGMDMILMAVALSCVAGLAAVAVSRKKAVG